MLAVVTQNPPLGEMFDGVVQVTNRHHFGPWRGGARTLNLCGGHQEQLRSASYCGLHTLIDLTHGAHFTRECDLTERNRCCACPAFVKSASNGECSSEIGCWFNDPHSAERGCINILIAESQAAVFFQYCNQHCQACAVKTAGTTLRCAKKSSSGKRLNFSKKYARSGKHWSKHTSWSARYHFVLCAINSV